MRLQTIVLANDRDAGYQLCGSAFADTIDVDEAVMAAARRGSDLATETVSLHVQAINRMPVTSAKDDIVCLPADHRRAGHRVGICAQAR